MSVTAYIPIVTIETRSGWKRSTSMPIGKAKRMPHAWLYALIFPYVSPSMCRLFM
jgi:hypothetical protein